MIGPLPLSGNLRTWDLPAILLQLQTQGLSGTLTIRHDNEQREMIFEGDRLRLIRSPAEADRFDQFLEDQGLLSRSQRQNLETTMKARSIRLVRALLENGLFTIERLWELVAAHQTKLLFSALTWTEGRFDIQSGTSFHWDTATDEIPIDRPILQLLLEGIRRIDDEAFLGQRFHQCQELEPGNYSAPAVDLLLDHERYILYLARNHSLLGEILIRSDLPTLSTLRTLYFFLLTGVLVPKQEPALPPNPRPQRSRIQSFHTFEEALQIFNSQYEYIYRVLSKEIGPVAASVLHNAVHGIIERLPSYLGGIQVTEEGRLEPKSILKAMWFLNFEQAIGEFLTALEEILYAEIFAVRKHLGREYEQSILQWIRDNGST